MAAEETIREQRIAELERELRSERERGDALDRRIFDLEDVIRQLRDQIGAGYAEHVKPRCDMIETLQRDNAGLVKKADLAWAEVRKRHDRIDELIAMLAEAGVQV